MCWLNPKVQGNYVFGLGVTLAVFGVILGHWMNKKLSDKSFFTIINIFIVVASSRLIYDGYIGL